MLPNIMSIQPHLALPDYNRADCNHSFLDPASVPLLFIYTNFLSVAKNHRVL